MSFPQETLSWEITVDRQQKNKFRRIFGGTLCHVQAFYYFGFFVCLFVVVFYCKVICIYFTDIVVTILCLDQIPVFLKMYVATFIGFLGFFFGSFSSLSLFSPLLIGLFLLISS